jgi:hypothetical protein
MDVVGIMPVEGSLLIAAIITTCGGFCILLSVSHSHWAETFRKPWRYGRNPSASPVSRTGFFMLGLSWVLSGLVIMALVLGWTEKVGLFLMVAFGPLIALAVIERVRKYRRLVGDDPAQRPRGSDRVQVPLLDSDRPGSVSLPANGSRRS